MEKNPTVLETKIETLQTILEKFGTPETDQQKIENYENIKKEIATDLLINKLKLESQTKGTIEEKTVQGIVEEYFN